MWAANCFCSKRKLVERNKSEKYRCFLKPVPTGCEYEHLLLAAWGAEDSVDFHPLEHVCHMYHKSSMNLNIYHSWAAVTGQTAFSVPLGGIVLGVVVELHFTPVCISGVIVFIPVWACPSKAVTNKKILKKWKADSLSAVGDENGLYVWKSPHLPGCEAFCKTIDTVPVLSLSLNWTYMELTDGPFSR